MFRIGMVLVRRMRYFIRKTSVYYKKSFQTSPPIKLLKLNAGKHKVEIKNPGFKSFSTTIIVKEGEVANIRHQF